MGSLENRINELCKGSMLLSPIWLARLIEEVFDASWIGKDVTATSVFSETNQWPLVNTAANTPLGTSTSWNLRSKTESTAVVKFLSPQGPLFNALRQSADAWVSVAFDSKLAQSDSVRIATGVQTIMRQPKVSTDMAFLTPRNFENQNNSNQNCMITLPVPHYFILRLASFLFVPDVIDCISKSDTSHQASSVLTVPAKNASFGVPTSIYSDLVDSYCEFLFSNAKQPPGTTLISSRSLCAELSRLYVQAVADFWLSPFASTNEAGISSISFMPVSLPPPVLLHFIRRFLKRYFYHVSDEWNGGSVVVRQTSFAPLKQPLFAFLHNCAAHWPLNVSFSNVLSCWRAVVLPWRAQKAFMSPTGPLTVWEPFVSENTSFYSESILVPLLQHLGRANVACQAYAATVDRLAKVFGGAPDTDLLTQLLLRISTSSPNQTNMNMSYGQSGSMSFSHKGNKSSQFLFVSPNVVSAVSQLVSTIDSTLASPSSSSNAAKEHLKNAKCILGKVFLANATNEDSITGFNDSVYNSSRMTPTRDNSRNSPGVLRFRQVPHRQTSFTNFGRNDEHFIPELDIHSTDIPVIIRFQQFLGMFLKKHGLTPKSGTAGTLANAATFRWMADRRELTVLGMFLAFTYLTFSSPAFFFFTMLYLTIRTFFVAMVEHLQDLFSGNTASTLEQHQAINTSNTKTNST